MANIGEVYGCLQPFEQKELMQLILQGAEINEREMIPEIRTGACIAATARQRGGQRPTENYALRHQSGSPRLSIHGTFRDVFHLTAPKRPLYKVGRKFRNPVFLAREWQQFLDSGESINAAEIARSCKVSGIIFWSA